MIKIFFALIQKECRLLCREIHEWLHPLIFFCMILLVFPLSFNMNAAQLSTLAPACIWIAALFANLLSIQHFFVSDLQDGFLQQSMLMPVSLTIQIFAKCIAHCMMQIVPLLLVSLVMIPMFSMTFDTWLILAIGLTLGMPIISLIGIFCAALTIGLRQQGVIMGVLIFPLIVPVIIFGVNMVGQYQAHLSVAGPIAFLAGLFVLAFTVLPALISSTLTLSIN